MDNFNEFFDAFSGEEAAAIEETPAAEEAPAAEEPAEETPAAGAEENPDQEDEKGTEGGEDGAEEQPAAETGAEDQTFTIDDQQYSLEEVTELARKGAGYDALQTQLNESEQSRSQLQAQLDGQQGAMDILNQIAQQSGKTLADLAKQMYINFRKSAGISEDAAALELENAQLKKQMDAGKPAQEKEAKVAEEAQARAKQEIAEFRKLHPNVVIDKDLVAKLKPDVQKGMSLANAYQKMLNEQKAAELAEEKRKIEAHNQNEKNKRNSPGSQQDSGGRREKSSFDDFFSQFK